MKDIIRLFSICLCAVAFFSCQNAKLPVIDNMVYISGAEQGRVGVVDMGEDGTDVTFTVRLAKECEEDVKVSIVLDSTVLEAYNKTYQSSYKHVRYENIEVPAHAVIPAGSINSAPLTVKVKDFETKGAQYAVALKIVSTQGIPVSEESSKYIFYLMKPLKQPVPLFSKACAAKCSPDEDWGIELMNYTLEWWVRLVPKYEYKPFYVNNQCILANGSSETELYIRFGDLLYGSEDFNYLQIKTMGAQFDTGDPRQGKGLSPNTWYHFAITYDGSTGKSILYHDGKYIADITTAAGKPMMIDRLFICQNITDYVEMCQLRLWKTTRTEAQINNNMRSEVEYTDPNLVLYLPMNEGEGAKVLRDVANDGEGEVSHSAAFGSHPEVGSADEAVSWTEYAF